MNIHFSRRWILRGAAAGAGWTLLGCDNSEPTEPAAGRDGGDTSSAAPQVPAPNPSPSGGATNTPTTGGRTVPMAFAAGKYRFNQQYLLQSSISQYLGPRVPGGSAFLLDIYGPTYKAVDYHGNWLWTRPGGDWSDANGVRHGTAPWFSIPTDKGVGSSFVASYDGDITSVAKHVQTSGRWFALYLSEKNAERTIAGRFNAQYPAPYVVVTYVDGTTEKLEARTVAPSARTSELPSTTAATAPLPAFIEFDRPRSAVASARLHFVVTEHWSGSNPAVEGFLLDPPITDSGVQLGVADGAGPLDAGIETQSGVLGAHRYIDGTSLSDFTFNGLSNWTAESNYDPAIYGTGPTDLTKLPHAGLGKWINADPRWQLVDSNYANEGFKPLAKGLGALRIHMPATPGVTDGSAIDSSGTTAGNAMIFLPESLFGRLGRIFVRYYFRLGSPYLADARRRYQVMHGTQADWTTFAGKFGIQPDHSTYYGGVSGSSGGGNGWQMRLSWYDCDAGTGGPDEGGWAPGFHLFDYYYQNPPGHNYGKGDGGMREQWGQRGGAGAMLYAGHWYCIETELKLNTVFPEAPGFQPDGELRAWIDGRLVFERTGMVFRTLPLKAAPYDPNHTRPCRELGVRGIWLDWFHGGKTVATIDRTIFYTGLVWSRQQIGPMKLPA